MHKMALLVTTTIALATALPNVPIAEAASEHVVYAFKGAPDGSVPVAGLLYLDRKLWGTTSGGGSNGLGTVFKVTTTGTENVVLPFSGLDGDYPVAGLIAGVYGTTEAGGANGCGTVFKVTPKTGAEKVLYSLGSTSTDACAPYAGLINVGGTLYGTTAVGGDSTNCPNGCGTVFSIVPRTRNSEKVVHSFQGATADGRDPAGGLVYVNGTLYGTTFEGGAHKLGTIFSIDPATGDEQVLYSFCSDPPTCADGANPDSGLVSVNGTLYGTTSGDEIGADAAMTVFSFDPATDTETVLYTFCSQVVGNACEDGWQPEAGLIPVTDSGGNTTLYGTTLYGGANNYTYCNNGCGVVFSLNLTTGAEQTQWSLQGGTDGAYPYAGLIAVTSRSGATTLYGTTAEGGGSSNCSSGCGTVFAVSP